METGKRFLRTRKHADSLENCTRNKGLTPRSLRGVIHCRCRRGEHVCSLFGDVTDNHFIRARFSEELLQRKRRVVVSVANYAKHVRLGLEIGEVTPG